MLRIEVLEGCGMGRRWPISVRIIAPEDVLAKLRREILVVLKNFCEDIECYDPVPSKRKKDRRMMCYIYGNRKTNAKGSGTK